MDKRVYWQLMRENYSCHLAEIQEVIADNEECTRLTIDKEGCILERKDGVKLYFDFTQAICRAEADLYMLGDPEKEDIRLVDSFLSGQNGHTVFDIGANVGLYSLVLYQNHSGLDYYLFEPVPQTFDWLRKTEKLNGVDSKHYKAFNLGMSDREGKIDFFVPATSEAASMVPNEDAFYRKKSNYMGKYTGDVEIDRIQCNVTTVDAWVDRNAIRDLAFMKIDVEGNELAVLKGAHKTLVDFEPLVYAELLRKHTKRFGYHPNDVINYMQSLGYDCATVRGGKIEGITSIDEETVETNFFFFQKHKHGGFFEKWKAGMIGEKRNG